MEPASLEGLEGLGTVVGKTDSPAHRPVVEVDKHIDHCTDEKKVPMDRKFAGYKPANLGTGEKKKN